MSEARFPGVYVDEGTGPPPIQGIDFNTTAFVGPTLEGPVGAVGGPLLSLADFEELFGGMGDFDSALPLEQRRNYVALAAHAYFDNGGKQLFVVRVAGAVVGLPTPDEYRAALDVLRTAPEIRVVAAPGYSARIATAPNQYLEIRKALVEHVADAALHRFAVLDPPPGVDPVSIEEMRGEEDVQRAALYYPWVAIADPAGGGALPIHTPPSGFVCGVYERVARERGLWRAPANEVLQGALRPERNVSEADAESLGQAGLNVLRTFPGSGPRIWGARTLSNDAVWKYISVRRYLDYLERSIDEGTRWGVFETNGERLWTAVRRVIEDFLLSEWRKGGLAGVRADEAFFVRCDRTTMTQDDIDNGRLIILIGVAPLKPAEFVIFRIGQWTQGGSNDDDD